MVTHLCCLLDLLQQILYEGEVEHYDDWIVEGPRVCEKRLEEMLRSGLPPSGAFQKFCTVLVAKDRSA